MIDISVEIAGVKLKNPLMVGAGPNTKSFRTALNCMKAGFGSIAIRSLHLQHVNQPPHDSHRGIYQLYGAGKDFTKSLYSFQSTGAPATRVLTKVPRGFGGAAPMPTLEEWAEEVYKITRAAKDYDCAVIGNIGWCGSNLTDEDMWKAEAKAMTDAGVDAIELHTAVSPATEPGRFMMLDHEKYLEMPIKATKEATNLPVFPKLPVDCCDTIAVAGIAQRAGADGVVPTTRWVSLPIDIEHEKAPILRGPGMGGSWSVPIMNGLIFRMRHATQPITYFMRTSSAQFPNAIPVTVPIIPSGGVRSGADVIGYLMAGANAAQICAQVILEGVRVAARIEKEIRDWMEQKGYQKISEFQGIVSLLDHSQAKEVPRWLPVVDESLCNACMDCIEACPNEAISLVNGMAHIDEDYCEGCRCCYYVCPTSAISLDPPWWGGIKEWTVS